MWIKSRGLRPGRRVAREQGHLLYDLDVADARRWHEDGGHADDCWCSTSDRVFVDRLAEQLRAVGFRTPMKWNETTRLVLSDGPGFEDRDDGLIRDAVRATGAGAP